MAKVSSKPRTVMIIDDPHVAPVNTRLALLASMAQSFDSYPHSAADWSRFKPPSEPPALQKPNRRARRTALARERKPKG